METQSIHVDAKRPQSGCRRAVPSGSIIKTPSLKKGVWGVPHSNRGCGELGPSGNLETFGQGRKARKISPQCRCQPKGNVQPSQQAAAPEVRSGSQNSLSAKK